MKVDALVNAQPLRRFQEIARDAEAAGFAGSQAVAPIITRFCTRPAS